jgi:hypothetical protein
MVQAVPMQCDEATRDIVDEVKAQTIDVDIDHGLATLKGTVTSYDARERAVATSDRPPERRPCSWRGTPMPYVTCAIG